MTPFSLSPAGTLAAGSGALQPFDGAAARLAGLLDSAMDGIITMDEAQIILLYNRAAEKIFGWPADQVIGRPLTMLMPPRFSAAHAGHVRRFGTTGVTSRRMADGTVIHGVRANGAEFPLEASISQLETPEGKLFTVILRDVTDRVRAQNELSAYAAAASAIREQEKTRVARELHDELAQSLTAIKMDTIWLRDRLAGAGGEVAAKIADMLAMIDGSVASTRRIAADLRPLLLDDLGLAPAIEWLVQNFTQRHGIPCSLQLDETLDLPEPWATGVFRIVQESLVNVAKHSGATHANVRVELSGGELLLAVEDDGRGFDVAAPRRAGSLGLAGLRERAQLFKGTVVVSSVPGQGTQVHARIPLDESLAAP
ncbi:MAG: PAS domain-containing sensor histidine kinase [Pseudomonadota bacterium]